MPRVLVERLVVERGDDGDERVQLEGSIVTIPGTTSDDDVLSPFKARFDGVKNLRLAPIVALPLDLAGFVVDDVSSHRLEGVSYRLTDYENGLLGLDCARFAIDEPAGFDVS